MKIEKRLISLDEAMEATHREPFWTESEAAYIRLFLVKLPKADAVPVVRCKDCKHYVLQACACRHDNFNGIIHMNGFCSYGERKDNETD